jgi:predicted RNA-binding Zn ribbon-like protein
VGDVRRMRQIGGHVAVDFVNTLGGSPDRADDEYLFDYADLLEWLVRAGLLSADRQRDLWLIAERAPADAAQVYEGVRRLRGSLDNILRCRLRARTADDRHLCVVRSAYAEAAAHATLVEQAGSYRLAWNGGSVRWPLWVVAAAALDLLADAPLDRLGRCEHCRWMFLDHSRNHSRRWCSMTSCGAVAKMRRHRAARAATSGG